MTNTGFLQELFLAEKETHLKTLATEVRALRTNGIDKTSLEKMFRAAHSLKGAARLVQELETERIAHQLEEDLKQLQSASTLDDGTYACLVKRIEELGGKSELATAEALQEIPEAFASHSSDLLYISSEHASELITAASELSFLSRQAECLVRDCSEEAGAHQIQSMRILSENLQRLCYRLRLTPIREIAPRLKTLTENLAPKLGKRVQFKLTNGDTLIDRDSLKVLESCFIQIVKNSLDHGVETSEERRRLGKTEVGTIVLTARQRGAVVEIDISDDGSGVDLQALREKICQQGYHTVDIAENLSTEELLEFLFVPGFSTRENASEVSGRGIGLDIVKATLTSLRGDARVRTATGKGTTFQLRFPSRLASFRAVMFRVAGVRVALPLTSLRRLLNLSDITVQHLDGVRSFRYEGQDLALLEASQVLKLASSLSKTKAALKDERDRPVVVLESEEKKVAMLVDGFDGEREIVVQSLDSRYGDCSKILGVAIADEGQLVSVLNPDELVPLALRTSVREVAHRESPDVASERRRILVVDDSLTVRELERRLLSQAGFDCEIAIDGADGLDKLRERSYSLVVTDIDMPRMNGFQLIEAVRGEPRFDQIPIIVVSYKERDQDRFQSLKLGAAAFLSKGSFRDESFVRTVKNVLEGNMDGN